MFKYATYCLYLSVLLDLQGAQENSCPELSLSERIKQRGEFSLVDVDNLMNSILENPHKEVLGKIEGHVGHTVNKIQSLESVSPNQSKALLDDWEQKSKLEYLEAALQNANKALHCSLENNKVMSTGKPPPEFQKLGSRYFYIERHVRQNWFDAAGKCRRMGGHLATPQDEDELYLIRKQLVARWYWLDISNLVNKHQYISLASGKEVSYLKWRDGEPKKSPNANCAYLYAGDYYTYQCNDRNFFICQAA
ncbi:accessory gland protein Acp29AB [Drosophila teissieri]|uniref:accessory gland protein Acp29AB n=1 Tax=Drosophila teissieri TaxID=7243 RepID=UPI001CBA524E|nr:accessory gland protein Acp29AB [Drosophila teissieri]